MGVEPSIPDQHSFVVRVWLEDAPTEAGQAVWRGSIQHVPDGRRQHLSQLSEILTFIWSYLEAMAVRPGWSWQVWRWVQEHFPN